jgi:uncharacterized protein DUF4398
MNVRPILFGCVLAGVAAGCGSSPVPVEKLASSEAAIRAAREMGAPNEPKAALHLKLAQEGLDKAKSLSKDGDNERAKTVLMRAQADAELSLAIAREKKSRAEAEQALEQVRALQQGGATQVAPSQPGAPMPATPPVK